MTITDTPELAYYNNGRPNAVTVENWIESYMYQNPEEVKPGLEANDTGEYSWYNPAGWFGAASPPETPEKEKDEEDVE